MPNPNDQKTTATSNVQKVVNYAIPPIAGGLSIILPYHWFLRKSALQTGGVPPSPLQYPASVLKGIHAAPTVALIVGAQMLAQQKVETCIDATGLQNPYAKTLASSVVVGALSSPLLAAFNGMMMGQSWGTSLRNITKFQAAVIAAREIPFVGVSAGSKHINNAVQKHTGDNKYVTHACNFGAGFLGSVLGHAADSALTYSQKNIRIQGMKMLASGMLNKGIGNGLFNLLFQETNSQLKSATREL